MPPAWKTPVLGLGPGEVDLLNDPHRAEEWQNLLNGATSTPTSRSSRR
ncbi:hypothetical protein OG588_46285 [Streptomyces prunicolor]|nr:hypothetical protein OG588_46285 [Streptomyces prunicolor]